MNNTVVKCTEYTSPNNRFATSGEWRQDDNGVYWLWTQKNGAWRRLNKYSVSSVEMNSIRASRGAEGV